MRIRCPHCHQPIELVNDDLAAEVLCPSCSHSFSLISGDTATFQHARGGDDTQIALVEKTRIGQFELIELVGRGSFGAVWKARDTQLDRIVAVKMPRRGQLDDAAGEMFFKEARAAAQLKHPNIVGVHEVGRTDELLYIVTDFVEGTNLKEWLADRRLAPREAAQLCAKIADAMAHAHAAGVVHRDLKPGNIMLDASGEPHITDFGLAKRDAGEIKMTKAGTILGTVAYMPPEQARGEAHLADARNDVYSLGVILFEALTGELPFRGELEMVLVQILYDEPASPRKFNSRVPRDLETICLKCLEKDPKRRYATAAKLAADLRRFLGSEPILARPITRPARAWRWCRRNPALSGTGVLAAMLLFAVLAVVTTAYFREKELRDGAFTLAEEKSNLATKNSELAETERQARRRADEQSQLALQTLNTVVFDIQRGLVNVPGAQDVRRKLVNTALAGLQRVARTLDTAPTADRGLMASHGALAEIFLFVGDAKGVGGMEEARKQVQLANRIALTLAQSDPSNVDAQRDLSISYEKLGDVNLRLGSAAAALEAYKKGWEMSVKQANVGHGDIQAQRSLSISYEKMGNANLQLENLPAARDNYKSDLEICLKLAQADPGNAQAQRDLAMSYKSLGDVSLELGDVSTAQDVLKKGFDISLKLANADPGNAEAQRDLALSYEELGDLNRTTGKIPDARDAYQKGLEIIHKLAQADPGNAQAQRDLAISYSRLGNADLQFGDVPAARDAFQKDLDISLKLANADPGDYQAQDDVAISYGKLGDMNVKLGNVVAAREAYEKRLAISLKLANSAPDNAEAQSDLAFSYAQRGDCNLNLDDVGAARNDYQKVVKICLKLAQSDPENIEAQSRLAAAYGNLGRAALAADEFSHAVQSFEQGVRLLEKADRAGKFAAQPKARDLLEDLRHQLKAAETAIHAVDDLEFALRQSADQIPQLLAIRSRVLARQGDYVDAAATAEKLAGLDPANAENLFHVAECYALCSADTKAAGSPAESSASATGLHERYATRAIELLQKLQATDYFKDRGHQTAIEQNHNFDPLRDRDAFKKLFADRHSAAKGDKQEGM